MSDASRRDHEGRWNDLVRRVRILTGGLIVLGLVWLATVAWLLLGFAPAAQQDVLSVERLEIVEPDGQLAFVLANSARPAPATIDGEILLAGQEEDLQEFFGVTRVFLGSDRDNEATLVLRDGRERPRIVLGVPADGEPFIRVLDEQGEVLAELPE